MWRAITDEKRQQWRAGKLNFEGLRRARISALFRRPLSEELADKLIAEYYCKLPPILAFISRCSTCVGKAEECLSACHYYQWLYLSSRSQVKGDRDPGVLLVSGDLRASGGGKTQSGNFPACIEAIW